MGQEKMSFAAAGESSVLAVCLVDGLVSGCLALLK